MKFFKFNYFKNKRDLILFKLIRLFLFFRKNAFFNYKRSSFFNFILSNKMNSPIKEIQEPIREEMHIFEKRFYEEIKSEVPLLDQIIRFVIKQKGKQIRPMLTFLIAKMIHGRVLDKTYLIAAAVEIIHTASLLHDDVVDESYLRRGFFSINALWKNKIAVLVGDYLFSKSLVLLTKDNHYDLLAVIAPALKEMSEGELLQLDKSHQLSLKEDQYYQIIEGKTASLIVACCKGAVISVDGKKEDIEKISQLARFVGVSFQIRDDLFDYENTLSTGKPKAIDIKEKKITLPLIYALEKAVDKERKWLVDIIRNHAHKEKAIKELVDYVEKIGGLVYSRKKMEEFCFKALELLKDFEDSSSKKALILLIQYSMSRSL